MSLLKSLKAKSAEFSVSDYRGNAEVSQMWGTDGRAQAFNYGDIKSCIEAYQKCSPLTTVINRKAQSYANGLNWVLTRGTKGKGKESSSADAKKLRKLMARPNPFSTWQEFDAKVYMYTQLFGFCVVLPMIPAGYEKYGAIEATSLWIIPSHIVAVKERKGIFYKNATDKLSSVVEEIKVTWGGETVSLHVDDVYIFRDSTLSFDSNLIPDSRVKVLEMPINNIIGAMESRNTLINYRGSNGIFTSDPGNGQYVAMAATEVEKQQLQDDFKRYGLRRKQWQYIITTAALKFQPIGKPTKDLMLFEEVVDSSKMICDDYGFPPHLLGLIDPTYANQNAAQKGLYQDTIMPEALTMGNQWNILFKTEDYNLLLDKDYSKIPVLQEDEGEKATALKARNEAYEIYYKNQLCTKNEWRLANGDDPLPDGDTFYVAPEINTENNGTGNTEPGAAKS